MCTRIDKLIKNIKLAKAPIIKDNEEIRVIIGNDDYPSSVIQNTIPTGIDIYDGFSSIAFLCNKKNINLISIVGLMLNSIDDAVELLDRICIKGETTMLKFAFYLAENRLILVNQKYNCKILSDFFNKHKNHKVLYVGKKNNAAYHKLVTKHIEIPHTSGQTYGKAPFDCYATYFDHNFAGYPGSNISLSDFKI